jgi:predicted esterase
MLSALCIAPLFAAIATAAAPATAGQDAEAPVLDLRIGDDENKRYFLIGPAADGEKPEAGYHLLVVLPGGDGGADFHPFVKNIHANALPEGYILAQVVAPKWSDDENRVVWPTKKLRDKKMKFPTEDFVEAIIKDVQGRHAIDPKHVYLLGWSSGGPPCYAASLEKDTPVRGVLVAMSVFKPEQLGPLARAKGKAYYILHSPTDFIKMSFPEAAAEQLAKKGAKTKLETYEGGHGWHGDVFGNIRRGIDWLEQQSAAAAAPKVEGE